MNKERTKTELHLDPAGIVLAIRSEVPLVVSKDIRHFLTDEEAAYTVHVRIGRVPVPDRVRGQDLALGYGNFAPDGSERFIAARMADEATSLLTVYTPDLSRITVWLNTEEYPAEHLCRADKILQVLPVRALLARHDALLLHSSRVEVGGRAIVFSAPSQTGKTTQARLWEKHMGARIVSNDRTVIRKMPQGVITTGFPVDGSSPVYDAARIPLGALVLLQQGEENRAERLSIGAAMQLLLPQTSIEPWDAELMTAVQLLWLDILSECPAYRLTCTPDEGAVRCLQEALKREGETGFGRES